MSRGLFAAVLAGAMMVATGGNAETSVQILRFKDLDQWVKDDHAAALSVFLNTCKDMDEPDWSTLCAVAKAQKPENARSFFELFFRPVLIKDGAKPMFTGYFEPELDGSRRQSARYRYPIYKMPPEARGANPWLTRQQIRTGTVMSNRGLEIAWVDDSVELFFLQIQGSGRIRLPSGQTIRVGYGGFNGHSYRSVGVELVRRGIYNAHQVSAKVIKSWVRRNPDAGRELLLHNPSYVFFPRTAQYFVRSRAKGCDEPIDYNVAFGGGRSKVHPLGRPRVGRKRRAQSYSSVDDCPRHRIGDQRCATGRCVFWHRGSGGRGGWAIA